MPPHYFLWWGAFVSLPPHSGTYEMLAYTVSLHCCSGYNLPLRDLGPFELLKQLAS